MTIQAQKACIVPWIHQYISERGKFYPCAFSTETGASLCDENDHELLATSPTALRTAWNSEKIRSMRREFMRGETPASCARCERLESFQIPSLREVSNRHWGNLLPTLLTQTNPEGFLSTVPNSFDLRFGNHCNLKCRMCSPESSQKTAEEFQALHTEVRPEYFEEIKHFDWFRNPVIVEKILTHALEIQELHFAGGEPFLIPEIFSFLEKLVMHKHSQHIVLSFNTNLTFLSKEITALWPQFKAVKLLASLDGHSDVNDYIRFPSKFSVIEKNLRTIDENFQTLSCSLLCIHTTVQAYNILRLPELIHFVTREFKNFFAFPILSPLHWPDELATNVLPQELKNLAKKRLENEIRENRIFWKSIEHRCDYPNAAEKFIQSIEGNIRLMMEPSAAGSWNKFQKSTNFFDAKRGQNILQWQKEFQNYWGVQ